MTGKIKCYSDRGFGFIASPEAGDVFFHISHFHADEAKIQRGMAVEFQVGEGKKGPQAVAIVPIGGNHE